MFCNGFWGFYSLRVLACSALACGLLAVSTTSFARTCEVAFRLDSTVTLGALQLTIPYWDAQGSWLTSPQGIDCGGDSPNTLVLFSDDPTSRIVTASFISLAGIAGPRQIGHCYFNDPSATTVPGDFQVLVDDAEKVDGKVVKARISALMPDCGPDLPTTTTTTTTSTTSTTETSTTTTTSTSTTTTSTTTSTSATTTLETTTTLEPTTTSTTLPFCGNGIVDDEEQCDDGNDVDGDGCDSDCTSAIVCGDANGNDQVQTSDALLVLRKAIGQHVLCPIDRCDADGDDIVRASDSLRVLKRAVGQSVKMSCPYDN
jgi:cysteine-rich repeat protein